MEDSRTFIEQTIATYQRGENTELAMELKADKKVIGTCGLISVSAEHCRGELAFAMAKEHWGGGLMAEALRATLAFGFGALELNRIWAKVDPDNMKTTLVLRRVSWQFEGNPFLISRLPVYWGNGEWMISLITTPRVKLNSYGFRVGTR